MIVEVAEQWICYKRAKLAVNVILRTTHGCPSFSTAKDIELIVVFGI